MNEEKQLNQETAGGRPPCHYPAPPNSRDPEVLADAIERHLDCWGRVSLLELACWLGEPFHGNSRLTADHDPNIVYWVNLCPEIVEALNILIQEVRVELRKTSCVTYARKPWQPRWLQLEKIPLDPGYYGGPYWKPVMLVIPPGRRPCQ